MAARLLARHAYLRQTFPDLAPEALATAASSEDAFDAAVSALVMDRHIDEFLAALEQRKDRHSTLRGCDLAAGSRQADTGLNSGTCTTIKAWLV